MRYVLLLTACLGLALSGCIGDADPGGNARDGGSVVVGVPALPTTIDPAARERPGRAAGAVARLHAAADLPPRRGSRGDRVDRGPGARPARDIGRRADLPAAGCAEGFATRTGALVRPGDFERAIERARALGSPLAALYAGIESIDAGRASGRITDHARDAGSGLLPGPRPALERAGAGREPRKRSARRAHCPAWGPTGSRRCAPASAWS